MSNVPPLPGLTRYTRQDQVPDGLHTRTQLRETGLNPGAGPVAQVLYHGNKYAPLYDRSAAVPRQAVSPARRAALARNAALRYTCRRCTTTGDRQLPRGRLCPPCSCAVAVWTAHDRARQFARELAGDPTATLLVVTAGPGEYPQPETVAVVRVHDQELLHAGPAGAYGTPERAAVLHRLDQLLDGRRVAHETDQGPAGRYPAMLVTPPGQLISSSRDGLHTWLRPHRESAETAAYVSRLWRRWYAWTRDEQSCDASPPWDRERGAWTAWDRTADAATDARALAALLHRIAGGTEPVWNHAAWLDGHGTPAQGDTQ